MKKIYLSLLLVVSAFVINAQRISPVIINELYGGGGNSNAYYTYDFVELYNTSDSPVDMSGWVLMYASPTGAWPASTNSNYLVFPSETIISAKSYFLIQLATQNSSVGVAFPAPADLVGGLQMGGTNGKIILTTNADAPTATNTVGLVGYGTATTYEGTAAAPSINNNSTSLSRTNFADTQNNNVDFTRLSPPTPVNSHNNITPVNLIDFTLVKGTNGVELSWKTAQEKDTKEFVIEHSTDNNNWSEIAKVAAGGNSSAPLSYAYTHENPANGVNYYRLKSVDLDGSFEYFTTKSINLQNEISIKLYPNPANDFVYISTAENKTDLSYNIYNAAGAKVLTGNVTGNAINISKLASGIYFVKISKVGGATTTVKIVKQ